MALFPGEQIQAIALLPELDSLIMISQNPNETEAQIRLIGRTSRVRLIHSITKKSKDKTVLQYSEASDALGILAGSLFLLFSDFCYNLVQD